MTPPSQTDKATCQRPSQSYLSMASCQWPVVQSNVDLKDFTDIILKDDLTPSSHDKVGPCLDPVDPHMLTRAGIT